MNTGLVHNVLDARLRRVERGSGVWLFDENGDRYLDGSSGAVVAAIGHAHPHVLAAIAAQAGRVTYAHRGAFTSDAAEGVAAKLCTLTGYAGTWLVNSGSEAVEAAVQFALQYFREQGQTQRRWFLAHDQGYHGNTLGALSLSGHGRRAAAGELAYGFLGLATPYQSRDGIDLTERQYCDRLLQIARSRFERHQGVLAGVVVEAIGGATLGVNMPPDGYLQGLRALCDEFGALLIVDEIMTGLGRTGTVLAVDHWQVRPDIVVLGKGLGAGYTPIAATLLAEHILAALRSGSGHVLGGHTYAANPLSSATALAVLEVLETEQLMAGTPTGRQLSEGLRAIAVRHSVVAAVRGLGLFQGLELRPDDAAGDAEPGVVAAAFAEIALQHGVVLYQATGGFNDAILVAPPLTIGAPEVDILLSTIDRSLSELESRRAAHGRTTMRSVR